MTRWLGALGAGVLLVAACSGAPAPSRPAPSSVRPAPGLPSPARWLLVQRNVVETRDDGVDLVVAGGRRFQVRGFEVLGAAAPEPAVDGGARLPPWVAGDVRYLFWRHRALYGAGAFDGPLRPLGEVRADVQRAFDWFGGAGLELDGGSALVDGAGRVGPGLPVTRIALASDARRGALITSLGHLRVSIDGGTTLRDLSLGATTAAGLERRGGAVVVRFQDSSRRAIDASGALVDPPPVPRPRDDEPAEPWPSGRRGVLAALAASGLPFDEGGAVIAGEAHVGRVDLRSLRTTAISELPGIEDDAECAPFRAPDALLAVCVGGGRATVFDIGGAPRVERTFAVVSEDLDRFVADDEHGALGFLGPCGAREEPPLARADNDRLWPASSPVFCARASSGGWVEHRIEPLEAREAIAWIARPEGAAAVVLAPPSGVTRAQAIERRGALRVVRIARGAAPVQVPDYPPSGATLLARSFTMGADDVIEGWLPSSSLPNVEAARIDAAGEVRQRALPARTMRVAHGGPVALAVTDDGGWHQTLDCGSTWRAVEPPPAALDTAQLACGPIACSARAFTRLGWDVAAGAVRPPERWRALPEARSRRRPPPQEPLARLVCRGAAPLEGIRQPDSFGFGVTPTPVPRGETSVPIGRAGVALFPSGSKLLGGDVDVGWLAPLDPSGRIHRARMPVSRAGIAAAEIPYLGLSIAPLLRADGAVDFVAARPGEACFDAFLEGAGVVRPGLGCVDLQSLGVEALGQRWFVRGGVGTTSILARPSGASRGSAASRWVEASAPGTHGRLVALGVRAGAPVLVLVDADGAAVAAPIGPRGDLGLETPLRSLATLSPATSPACTSAPTSPEATVLVASDGAIAIHAPSIAGVSAGTGVGLAVVRWSRERACLEAVELPIRDERVDVEPSSHDGAGTVRKVVALFGRSRAAAIVDIGPGAETRQRLSCDDVVGSR